jgi:AraC-like DNA-binding protein
VKTGLSDSELKRRAEEFLDDCARRKTRPVVSSFAKKFRMPLHEFSNVFLDIVGERPSKYLKLLQIQRAQELLASTNLPFEEIAHACCFRDLSTFFRAFRRITSSTPGQFRRRARLMHPYPTRP